jgi:hypothetical protein
MMRPIPASSPRPLSQLNSAAVLGTIYAAGPISGADRVTGLSTPTADGAVELLLESAYVTERLPDVIRSTLGDEAVALEAAQLALKVVEEPLFDMGLSEA